jgi:hypothetical protein
MYDLIFNLCMHFYIIFFSLYQISHTLLPDQVFQPQLPLVISTFARPCCAPGIELTCEHEVGRHPKKGKRRAAKTAQKKIKLHGRIEAKTHAKTRGRRRNGGRGLARWQHVGGPGEASRGETKGGGPGRRQATGAVERHKCGGGPCEGKWLVGRLGEMKKKMGLAQSNNATF